MSKIELLKEFLKHRKEKEKKIKNIKYYNTRVLDY